MTSKQSRSSKVGAKLSRIDHIGQMLVGGRDDPDIDSQRPRGTDPRDLAIFDRPQQPLLRAHAQGPKLIKEQCAAIGLFKAALARPGRTCKCASLMPEQFRLDQGFGQSCTVHRDQRPIPARTQPMQTLGDQLLAGPPLPDHQHRPVERRRAARTLDSVQKG